MSQSNDGQVEAESEFFESAYSYKKGHSMHVEAAVEMVQVRTPQS